MPVPRPPGRAGAFAHRALSLAVIVLAACGPSDPEPSPPELVGRAVCAECHAEAAERFAATQHALAMQLPDSAVIARFDGSAVEHHGTRTDVFARAGRPMVRTQGDDGAPGEFAVSHALGVYPLQQYLVPREDGRLQVLPVAWDARARADGGQRWFHLYPRDSIAAGDELHWTGPQQTWNYMCAECHVTGLRRNYDVAADAYRTTWFALGVDCEACHGPGSAHVDWARTRESRGRAFDPSAAGDRNGVHGEPDHTGAPGHTGLMVDLGTGDARWVLDSTATIARRSEPLEWNAQTETCGRCHARRETLVDDYVPGRPLLATHRPVLLDEGLYHPDGQILDEVYEYGSFLQSRMHRAGVTCSDCHDATTQEVPPGNAVCARCHRPSAFDSPEHHFHETGSTGAECVACHMPPRTYMVVDPRHDHSLRIPRPDLSLRTGVPNACTACHTDRSDEWADQAVRRWYGPPPGRHYGDVLYEARGGDPSADTALARLAADTAVAGIVRATAVSLLERYPTPVARRAILEASRDPEPLVRLAAAGASVVLDPNDRWSGLFHLLEDPLLAVRVEAARVLAPVPDARMTEPQRTVAAAAFDEFVAAQRVNAERPEVHVRLGLFHAQRGRPAEAERAYREAIRLGPAYAGGYANLADLYREQGRDGEGERVLRAGLENVHRPGILHHSLGLLLVRTRRLDEAVPELERAATLESDAPRFALAYALALDAVDRTGEAVTVLEEALERTPRDRELNQALAGLARPED